jgi:hypothetical protein
MAVDQYEFKMDKQFTLSITKMDPVAWSDANKKTTFKSGFFILDGVAV